MLEPLRMKEDPHRFRHFSRSMFRIRGGWVGGRGVLWYQGEAMKRIHSALILFCRLLIIVSGLRAASYRVYTVHAV